MGVWVLHCVLAAGAERHCAQQFTCRRQRMGAKRWGTRVQNAGTRVPAYQNVKDTGEQAGTKCGYTCTRRWQDKHTHTCKPVPTRGRTPLLSSKDLGGSIRTYQNCRSSQMGTTPKRGLKNHFEKLHNCALQGTPLKSRELSKMTVCRGYHMCQSKFMYPFQIWALQCPSKEKSNSSISSGGAFQTTLQNGILKNEARMMTGKHMQNSGLFFAIAAADPVTVIVCEA